VSAAGGEPAGNPSERSQRAREAARLLPLVGLFLVLPPMIALFAVPVDVAGVPLLVVYFFAVWLGLVLAAALLGRAPAPPPPGEQGESET
jgi:hypothetical protein